VRGAGQECPAYPVCNNVSARSDSPRRTAFPLPPAQPLPPTGLFLSRPVDNSSPPRYLGGSAGFIRLRYRTLNPVETLPRLPPEDCMSLVETLIKKGLLQEQDLNSLAEVQAAAPNRPVHELLIERGFAREEDVLATLAEECGLELVDLTKVTVEPETLKAMPLKLVHRRALMPLSRVNGTLVVATGDPYDVYSLDELQTLTGLVVQPVLASAREIARLIKAHFGVGGETVTAMVQERGEEIELLEEIEADDSELAKQAQEASVVKLVNEILIEAANERASDIHIEPEEKTLRIRYRIDGLLQTQILPPEITRFQNAIISRITILSRLNI